MLPVICSPPGTVESPSIQFLTQSLKSRLLPGWVDLSDDKLILTKFIHHPNGNVQPLISFVVRNDFSWSVFVLNKEIDKISHSLLCNFPLLLKNIYDVDQVYCCLSHCHVCIGNADSKFCCFMQSKKGVLCDKDSTIIAYLDNHIVSGVNKEIIYTTVRHQKCALLVKGGLRCNVCMKYRHQLRALHSRYLKQHGSPSERTKMSSNVNFRYLSTPEKKIRFANTRTELFKTKLQLSKLQEMIKSEGINLDEGLHSDLAFIMSENNYKVMNEFMPGSFQRLFWEEQLKCSKLSSIKNMRWHPMVIRWCLYLKHLSSGTYEALRSTGVLTLPSQRTLRDYSHHIPSKVGFDASVDDLLLSEAKMEELDDFQKYVVILMDEMHIKDDLVYNKHTGELVGFVNLGGVVNDLMQLNNQHKVSLASSVFVLMVKGLFIRLEFPYASFPTTGITGDAIFPIVWEAIRRLELCEFKVLAITADGASPNRKFFNMHQLSQGITYKTKNPYSDDGRDVYFISDPPPTYLRLLEIAYSTKNDFFGYVTLIMLIYGNFCRIMESTLRLHIFGICTPMTVEQNEMLLDFHLFLS